MNKLARIQKFEETYILKDSAKSDIMSMGINQVIEKFKKNNLILFRDFDIDNERFRKFSDQFGKDFHSYSGGSHQRAKIDGKADTLAVPRDTYGGYAIPAHQELAYTAAVPKLIWFYCSVPPRAAGQTTVYDGVEIWNHLSKEAKKLFTDKRIKYTAHYPESRWQEIYQSNTPEGVGEACRRNGVEFVIGGSVPGERYVHTEFKCWAMQKTAFTNETAFVNHILSSVYARQFGIDTFVKVHFEDNECLSDLLVSELYEVTESLSYAPDPRLGDLFMVDNTRFMHGRRSFFGKREVQLRMCTDPIPQLGYGQYKQAA